MKKIIFVTGNSRKLGEAKSSCDLFNIDIEQVKLDIDEIQSHDPIKIALHKANLAFMQLNKPIVINDAYWSIPSLNGFPGGYAKDISDWFEAEDFIALMKDKKDRSINITENVIYKDKNIEKVFTKKFYGTVSDRPKGIGESIEQVAVFNGITLAEHHDKGEFSELPEEQVWYEFAKWYSNLV